MITELTRRVNKISALMQFYPDLSCNNGSFYEYENSNIYDCYIIWKMDTVGTDIFFKSGNAIVPYHTTITLKKENHISITFNSNDPNIISAETHTYDHVIKTDYKILLDITKNIYVNSDTKMVYNQMYTRTITVSTELHNIVRNIKLLETEFVKTNYPAPIY